MCISGKSKRVEIKAFLAFSLAEGERDAFYSLPFIGIRPNSKKEEKMRKDDLGKRMKEYEDANKTYLTRRTPVMIRLDGNAFHTFTRGFVRPFDDILVEAMQRTMKYLCENISGCVLGYTQSDEITLLLIDYRIKNITEEF